jgi:hypothetical protein|tara:strand:- start:726 stop:1076 length:351 start_codon:yes stop_codon:yes gene_type:complete
MKRIPILIFIIFLLFIYGCGKEEITTQAYKIEEIEAAEEEVTEENITTIRLCHDTDRGMVRWVNGTVFGFYDNATRFEFNDYCLNFNYLWEFYCENGNPLQEIFLCINGCEDNHCL